jgi:enterochelin esterase family protein
MTDWLERARNEGTPLIDGSQVTFVWQGPKAPRLIADFNGWEWGERITLSATEQADVWTYSITLPNDAYLEYAFLIDGERALDPHNARRIWNGISADNNVMAMPGFEPNRWKRRRPKTPRGTLTRQAVDTVGMLAGKQRTITLYQPPTDAPSPLLVVYDGRDYLRRAFIVPIIENLIAAGEIAPIALALVDNGKQARMLEYMCADATLFFITNRVLPLAQQHLNVIDIEAQPGAYGILGASMGGLMALHTGLSLPRIFGKIISQSGAFEFTFAGHDLPIFAHVRALAGLPLRIWQDVGTLEWLLGSNRTMHAALTESGWDHRYVEFHAGHNYTAWSTSLPDALMWAFGAPRTP